MLTVLDTFAGIGGFSLGLERTGGFKTVQFIEIDPFCHKVLAKHWPDVPCHDDIITYEFREGEADVVTGGFPCQDISVAGRGAGLAGERSGLWRELVRALRLVRPRYAIFENVAALLYRGLGECLCDLAEIGYDAEWHCIPDKAAGAPIKTEHTWIVARPASVFGDGGSNNGDSRRGQVPKFGNRIAEGLWKESSWSPRQPGVLRGIDGLSNRVDRLRSLGNAIVPQIPELIGRAILAAEAERLAA